MLVALGVDQLSNSYILTFLEFVLNSFDNKSLSISTLAKPSTLSLPRASFKTWVLFCITGSLWAWLRLGLISLQYNSVSTLLTTVSQICFLWLQVSLRVVYWVHFFLSCTSMICHPQLEPIILFYLLMTLNVINVWLSLPFLINPSSEWIKFFKEPWLEFEILWKQTVHFVSIQENYLLYIPTRWSSNYFFTHSQRPWNYHFRWSLLVISLKLSRLKGLQLSWSSKTYV